MIVLVTETNEGGGELPFQDDVVGLRKLLLQRRNRLCILCRGDGFEHRQEESGPS